MTVTGFGIKLTDYSFDCLNIYRVESECVCGRISKKVSKCFISAIVAKKVLKFRQLWSY